MGDISYTDNEPVLNLFMSKPIGLLSLLDEQSRGLNVSVDKIVWVAVARACWFLARFCRCRLHSINNEKERSNFCMHIPKVFVDYIDRAMWFYFPECKLYRDMNAQSKVEFSLSGTYSQ